MNHLIAPMLLAATMGTPPDGDDSAPDLPDGPPPDLLPAGYYVDRRGFARDRNGWHLTDADRAALDAAHAKRQRRAAKRRAVKP